MVLCPANKCNSPPAGAIRGKSSAPYLFFIAGTHWCESFAFGWPGDKIRLLVLLWCRP